MPLARRLPLLAAVLLAACARGPAPPVHYFADGEPPKLSDWHVLIDDGSVLRLNEGVVPYDLNTPLFSDYAHKLRTVWMPKGEAAKYEATAAFDFPVGTIISKTFYYPLPAGDVHDGKSVARTYATAHDFHGTGLDKRHVRLVETRILVRREHGWDAIPYSWNAQQTEAELARTGDLVALDLVAADGSREPFTYVVPSENQCASCHVSNVASHEFAPLGPKARHLNRDFAYADGTANQLEHWTKVGYLTGAPAPSAAPRDAVWDDATQPLDARARAYFDINCGHCHNAAGAANTTGLTLDSATTEGRHLGICKPPVAAGRGTGDHFIDVVPGKPDDSIVTYRLASAEPGVMMPEMGRTTVHREGVELLRAWISSLPGSCTP